MIFVKLLFVIFEFEFGFNEIIGIEIVVLMLIKKGFEWVMLLVIFLIEVVIL